MGTRRLALPAFILVACAIICLLMMFRTTDISSPVGTVTNILNAPTVQNAPNAPGVYVAKTSPGWVNMTHACISEILGVSKSGVVDTSLHIFTEETECEMEYDPVSSYPCASLKANFGQAPICIYKPDDDLISDFIVKYGAFERPYIDVAYKYMEPIKEMALLDLGCNIGVFTVMAAKMGRKIVSVDANRKNLRLLARSLEKGGRRDDATLVWGALADIRGGLSLYGVEKGNIGASRIDRGSNNINTPALLLDDLRSFFGEESVFVKMDIEGYEWNALKAGGRFFSKVNVRYVFMEWVFHSNNKERSSSIIEFLTNKNFEPYHPTQPSKLNLKIPSKWPGEIIWVKQ